VQVQFLASLEAEDSRQEQGFFFFFFAIASILTLHPIDSPNQRVPGAVYPRLKQPEHEADHAPPSRAEIKNA
jgi:hypothetical protein